MKELSTRPTPKQVVGFVVFMAFAAAYPLVIIQVRAFPWLPWDQELARAAGLEHVVDRFWWKTTASLVTPCLLWLGLLLTGKGTGTERIGWPGCLGGGVAALVLGFCLLPSPGALNPISTAEEMLGPSIGYSMAAALHGLGVGAWWTLVLALIGRRLRRPPKFSPPPAEATPDSSAHPGD